MRHNELQFRVEFWKMEEGTAMGNALSPLLAEVFLASYERELQLDQRFPRFWRRYAIVNARQATKVLEFERCEPQPEYKIHDGT